MVKEARDAEKAAEKARKDTERQAQAEEKARRDADREAERVRKQAEKEEKRVAMEVERERKEERKRKAAEEKQRREEEKQRVEEEKRRKERGQKTLSSFFGVPKVKREENSASPAAEGRMVEEQGTPSKVKKKLSMYEKMFPPFFTRADVTLAPINRFERDEQGAEVVQHTIDGYVTGERSSGRVRAFDAAALLHILPGDFYGRGKQVIPVKEIMAEVDGNAAKPIDLTTESQNSQIRREGNLLQSVRMKYLSFPEDVRPAYWGTYTSSPRHGLRKLARNPIRKDNMNTDYDYDSEAEWVEDEDAEDCNSDGDEEDEPDDGDDMNEFLDDEGDELVNSKRSVIQGDLIPISTGLCWEDRKKRNTNVKMMPYRMEFIIGECQRGVQVVRITNADNIRSNTQNHRSLLDTLLATYPRSRKHGPTTLPHAPQHHKIHQRQRPHPPTPPLIIQFHSSPTHHLIQTPLVLQTILHQTQIHLHHPNLHQTPTPKTHPHRRPPRLQTSRPRQ